MKLRNVESRRLKEPSGSDFDLEISDQTVWSFPDMLRRLGVWEKLEILDRLVAREKNLGIGAMNFWGFICLERHAPREDNMQRLEGKAPLSFCDIIVRTTCSTSLFCLRFGGFCLIDIFISCLKQSAVS